MLALFYLISSGWNTINFTLTRNQATQMTIVMAAVYLVYSAYFLSGDFDGMSILMKVRYSGQHYHFID